MSERTVTSSDNEMLQSPKQTAATLSNMEDMWYDILNHWEITVFLKKRNHNSYTCMYIQHVHTHTLLDSRRMKKMGLRVHGGHRDGMWEGGQSTQLHGVYYWQSLAFCFGYRVWEKLLMWLKIIK